MLPDKSTFFDYPERLRHFLEQERISYPELSNTLLFCSMAAQAASSSSAERISKTSRLVFMAIHDIFYKFQGQLAPEQKREVLGRAIRLLIVFPELPDNFLEGIEAPALKIFLCAVQALEGPSTTEIERKECRNTIQAVFIGLSKIDVRTVPILQAIPLFTQCLRLFIRNIDSFDDIGFDTANVTLGLSAKKVGSFGGVAARALACWKAETDQLDPKKFDSYRFVERLFRAVWMGMAGISRTGAPTRPEIDASVRSLFDSLIRIYETFFLKQHSQKEQDDVCALWINILAEASTICPSLLVERYERLKKPTDPSIPVVSRNDALRNALIGLDRIDINVTPPERVLTHYAAILAAMIEQSGLLTQSDFVAATNGLAGAVKGWASNPSLVAQMILADLQAIESMRGLPEMSSDRFQNLFEMAAYAIHRIATRGTYIDQAFSEILFKAVDGLLSVVPRVAVANAAERDDLDKAKEALMVSVHGLRSVRPTISLDWFDRTPSSRMTLCMVIHKSLTALQKMGPGRVSDSYASGQFGRSLAFALHHLPEMGDNEFSCFEQLFPPILELWTGRTEIIGEIVRVWTHELRPILDKCCTPGASTAGRPSDASRGSKKRGALALQANDVYMRRIASLLWATLRAVEKGNRQFPQEDGPMQTLTKYACELIAHIVKSVCSREDLIWITDELFEGLTRAAPGAMVDWLAQIEPSTASTELVRKMEKQMLVAGRYTLLGEIQMRLTLLELVGAMFELYCYKEGVSSGTGGPTLPSSSQDPFDVRMRESEVLGDLDVACAVHCKEYASDRSKRLWVLFTLRRYLRTFIQMERRAYSSIYRWAKSMFPTQTMVDLAISNGRFGPKSLLPRDEGTSSPLMRQYDEFCEGRPPQSGNLCSFLEEAAASFRVVFSDAVSRGKELEADHGRFWPYYERGVQVASSHIKKMTGYRPLAELTEEPIGLPLLGCSDAVVKEIGDSMFQRWISRMLEGGEEGLARAIAEAIAPTEPSTNRFLREMRLFNNEESSSPEEVSPNLSSPAEESPKPQKPSVKSSAKPAKAKPKKKRAAFQIPASQEEESSSPAAQSTPVQEVASCRQEESLEEEFQKFSLDERAVFVPQPPSWARPVTISMIEECLKRPLGGIDWRVHRWKSDFFKTLSLDQYDRHTYLYQLIHLIRKFGEKEDWASRTGRMNEHFVCIGSVERYGRRLPSLFGIFSEAFSTADGVLYHHDILERSTEDLKAKFRKYGTFFDLDIRRTPKATTEFQEALYNRLCASGSFFSSLDHVRPERCCDGRFSVQIGDATVRIDDLTLGNAYTLALKVLPTS